METPGEQAKNKVRKYYERPMTYKKYVNYGHTNADAVKQCRRLQGAATKDITKIGAPVPNSNAHTA